MTLQPLWPHTWPLLLSPSLGVRLVHTCVCGNLIYLLRRNYFESLQMSSILFMKKNYSSPYKEFFMEKAKKVYKRKSHLMYITLLIFQLTKKSNVFAIIFLFVTKQGFKEYLALRFLTIKCITFP